MTKRQTPPGLNSKAEVVVVKPSGPHHCARCCGSLKAENTSSRGASNTRVPTMERGSRSRSMLFVTLTLLSLGLQHLQVIVEAIEPLFPEPAIFGEPVVDRLECRRLELAGTPLRLTRTRDQPGVFQHLEMLGDGGPAQLERLGEFAHRGLAQCEPGQKGAPRRIGERGEGGAEAVGGHGCIEPLG